MDRKQLTTALAAVFMVSVLVAVGLRLWASTARNSMPQLAMVHAGPDGGLYTMLGDTLYIDDADGNSKRVIPLSRLGISGFWGDFAVLADGGIILPASKQPKDSLGKEARIALREPASGGDRAGAVPLTRCAVETLSCQPLTGSPAADYFQADRTFKLAVDEAAGRIYVADTAEQRLLILDMQGRILARQTSGLQFPNQLVLLQPGLLEVADTNGLALRQFDVSADNFVARGEPEPTVGWARGLTHGFPVGLAADKHGGQWVVLADGAIEHGQLYRRASDTDAPRRLPLPENADVLFLAAAGYHVLAPDQANYVIHAFSLDGEALPDAGSDTLQAALADHSSSRRLYDALFSYSLTALLAVLGLLFIAYRVMRLNVAAPGEGAETVTPQQAVAARGPAPVWSGREVEFRRRFGGAMGRQSLWLACGVMALMVGIAAMFFLGGPTPAPAHSSRHTSDQSDLVIIAVLAVLLLVGYLLSRRYERLYLSHTGIRYTTYLGGPAAFLAPLYPSWELRWDELMDIRLQNRRYSRGGMTWFYVFAPKAAKERQVYVMWQAVGAPREDLDLSLWQILNSDVDAWKTGIAGTQLFRLLDLAMRAHKEQFRHTLIQE